MLGFNPVFVDVDPYTFNMDPKEIEKHITPKTRAIVPVHLFGLPCNMEAIMEIAKRNGLQVLEDSCETAFAKMKGQSVGSFGDAACFSQYVAHHVVAGVGGMVTTNDAALEVLCRSFMAHGRDSIYTRLEDDENPTSSIIERRYKFDRLGFSYRCTELEAALGLAELERWEENIGRRRSNAALLTQLLGRFEDYLQLPYIPKGYEHSFMMFPMVCKAGVDREALLMYLEKHAIETRYMFPLLSQPVYRRLFPGMAEKYPVARHLETKGFFVGMHQGMDSKDMHYIADTFAGYFGRR
jgi:dTDP-4-amino-4,6-dideoxygalactose transaminase